MRADARIAWARLQRDRAARPWRTTLLDHTVAEPWPPLVLPPLTWWQRVRAAWRVLLGRA